MIRLSPRGLQVVRNGIPSPPPLWFFATLRTCEPPSSTPVRSTFLNPSSLCSIQQKDRQVPIYEDRNGERNVGRNPLAQCLEYAGWARLTNLDEVVRLYDGGLIERRGVEAFLKDWQDFTVTTIRRTIPSRPRLILIAREAAGRICFAKNARRSREKVRTVYPYFDDFFAAKNRFDPEHWLESNLTQRLQRTVR